MVSDVTMENRKNKGGVAEVEAAPVCVGWSGKSSKSARLSLPGRGRPEDDDLTPPVYLGEGAGLNLPKHPWGVGVGG